MGFVEWVEKWLRYAKQHPAQAIGVLILGAIPIAFFHFFLRQVEVWEDDFLSEHGTRWTTVALTGIVDFLARHPIWSIVIFLAALVVGPLVHGYIATHPFFKFAKQETSKEPSGRARAEVLVEEFVSGEPVRIAVTNHGEGAEFYASLEIGEGIQGGTKGLFARWAHKNTIRTWIAKGETGYLVLARLDKIESPHVPLFQWKVLAIARDRHFRELAAQYPSSLIPLVKADDVRISGSVIAKPDAENGIQPFKIILEAFRAIDGTPKPASEPEPTLVSLMDSSFPRLNKLWGKPILHFEDDSTLQITSALYFDLFTSGAKFLGFHVPRTPRVLEACFAIATRATELGDALGNGGLKIICKTPGENPQTVSDLRYSGKVYLYHDDALTHKQMADVEEMFNNQQLTVVLRGPDFLTQAWIAWKKKSLKPPA